MNTRLLFSAAAAACFALMTVAAEPSSAAAGRQALRDSGPGWLTTTKRVTAFAWS